MKRSSGCSSDIGPRTWRGRLSWIGLVLISFAVLVLGVFCTDRDDAVTSPDPDQPWPDLEASWSPDGNVIAVALDISQESRGRGIYLVDFDTWSTTGPILEATSQLASIQWSPSGEWLLFSMGAQIFKMQPDGDSLTQLTFRGSHFSADWSPSDTLIAMNWTLGDSGGVWLMRTDGSDQRLFAYTASSPRFDSSDSLLLVSRIDQDSDSSHLALICTADSTVRTVYSWVTGEPYVTYYYPCISQTDRRIALAIDYDIFTMTIEGTELTRLTFDDGTRPSWSPDGSKIVYVKPTLEGGSLWIMDADGGNKTHVPGW